MYHFQKISLTPWQREVGMHTHTHTDNPNGSPIAAHRHQWSHSWASSDLACQLVWPARQTGLTTTHTNTFIFTLFVYTSTQLCEHVNEYLYSLVVSKKQCHVNSDYVILVWKYGSAYKWLAYHLSITWHCLQKLLHRTHFKVTMTTVISNVFLHYVYHGNHYIVHTKHFVYTNVMVATETVNALFSRKLMVKWK